MLKDLNHCDAILERVSQIWFRIFPQLSQLFVQPKNVQFFCRDGFHIKLYRHHIGL